MLPKIRARRIPNLFRTAILLLLAAPAAASIGDTLSTLPAPGGCPAGIAYHGGLVWVADWERAVLFGVDPASGEVRREVASPSPRPEGLASNGDLLFVSDQEKARVYAFDPDRGLTLWSFPAPESSPRDLAYGGGSLWLLDDGSDTIYELVPGDGTILNYYKAPHQYCRGLAHDGRYLWVTERIQDEIYLVEPSDGTVLFLVKAPGPFPCGLAFHLGSLWLADFEKRTIWLLRTEADIPYRVTDEKTRDIRFRHILRNDGDGMITEAAIHIALPYDSLENQVLLRDVTWTRPPDEITSDRWGEEVAVFRFQSVPGGAQVEAGYDTRVRLGELHYAFYPDDVGVLSGEKKEFLQTFTAPTSRLQLDKEIIPKTAKEIAGDETNPYWIARRIFDWVNEKLEYERVGGWDVPTTLIRRGTGSCSEYSFLYIALCRAAGLPARYEGSVVVRGDDASIDNVYHRWCEVFLPGIGWMPVDPSGGDNEWPADQARYFGGLANRFLITTHGGGDSEYLGWDYNAHAVYVYEGRGTVFDEGYGVWSPVEDEEAQGGSSDDR